MFTIHILLVFLVDDPFLNSINFVALKNILFDVFKKFRRHKKLYEFE